MTRHPQTSLSEPVRRYVDEHAPVLLLRFDADGNVIYGNRHARQLLGDLADRRFQDVFVDFDKSLNLQSLASSQSSIQLDIARADNVPVSHLCHVERVDEGYLLCGAVDLLEYERLQDQILQLNRDLTNTTRELHKRNAELAVLNKQKNHFLGMAAHDLRKPVGLIATYTEFLIEEATGQLDEEHAEFVKTIRDMSWSMSRLIDDFLDVSAIESGRLELHLADESLAAAIQHACTLVAPTAKRNRVTLDIHIPDSLPDIEMDAGKIEQVVTNLLSNAVEHSPPDSVATIAVEPGDQRQVVSVSDQGPGIAKEQQQTLFTPFARGRTKSRRDDRSIGLGLAISKAIVDAHHGTLSVDSEPGQGTTFHVALPLAQSANTEYLDDVE